MFMVAAQAVCPGIAHAQEIEIKLGGRFDEIRWPEGKRIEKPNENVFIAELQKVTIRDGKYVVCAERTKSVDLRQRDGIVVGVSFAVRRKSDTDWEKTLGATVDLFKKMKVENQKDVRTTLEAVKKKTPDSPVSVCALLGYSKCVYVRITPVINPTAMKVEYWSTSLEFNVTDNWKNLRKYDPEEWDRINKLPR